MKLASKAGQKIDLEPNFTFAIVASDTVDISTIGAKFHVNQTGWYNILLSGNETPVKLWLVAGVAYPYRIMRLFVTNTDAAALTGLVGITSVFTELDRA